MKPKVSDYTLWTHCRYKAPDTEHTRGFVRREEPAQFATCMQHTWWPKRREEMLAQPVKSLQAGLQLDTQEVLVHTARGEDVRLTAAGDSHERVYMPTDLKNFWSEHKAMWQFHVRQHHQLIEVGVAVVQEYRRLRLDRSGHGSIS